MGSSDLAQKGSVKTKAAVLWTSLLNEPLFSVYALLAFILRKDLGASAFQISLLIALKPVVALFSSYWTARASRRDKLISNVIGAGVLARVPFLLFPFFDNVWFVIAAGALHMLFSRAGTPAWMEILKLNLEKRERERCFSLGSAIGYGEGVVIAFAFGALLDHHVDAWKWLFFFSALIGLVGVWIQRSVPVCGGGQKKKEVRESGLLTPWKSCVNLLRSRKDFAEFQWGFMACGFGIMLIQPALPLFFVDVLHLSYTDLAIAFSICKGLGFVFSSQLWAKAMGQFSIANLSAVVFIAVGLFPFLLLLAPLSVVWLYLAYVIYGIAQAGSHLIWNLSGPIFARHEDSLPYTNVNIALVGVRGMVAPPIGGFFSSLLGPVYVLIMGVFLCVYGGYRMLFSPHLRAHELKDKSS